ncbi:DnaJ C-terminal domain-containing protein [Photobacterium lipolyticum]|uniref:Cytochrome C biogenesis protein n=1 Tax=Photobacterium lipolyticum TaxID=266810 RepID=A0A2T3N0L1_9GAMM|nr:DnaJ C-terminal domain-containing protein [Photobacterium lipolyticum]PSW05794.1 cytochrome C biogenesis protein [Photobacterium lipolyticum]
MEYRDYYAILDVPRNATQADIKRAYKKLARKYHPDVCKEADADKKFIQVREAYEALKDPKKRAAYDQLGDSWHSGQEFTAPPNWERNFHFSGDNFTQGDAAAFSDFFESLFGNPFQQTRPRSRQAFRGHSFTTKGEDQHAKIQIDIEDSFLGTTRTLTLQDHSLQRQQAQTISLRIPKGIREGQQIRLSGKGLPGQSGGANGDLYLEVSFRSHPFYRIEQKNLCLVLPIAPWEAVLGAKVKLPTPTGPLEVTVPANSASGQTLRLSGRGLPGNPPGDMLIKLNIVLPKVEDEQSKALFRQMKDTMPFNPRSKLGV